MVQVKICSMLGVSLNDFGATLGSDTCSSTPSVILGLG